MPGELTVGVGGGRDRKVRGGMGVSVWGGGGIGGTALQPSNPSSLTLRRKEDAANEKVR